MFYKTFTQTYWVGVLIYYSVSKLRATNFLLSKKLSDFDENLMKGSGSIRAYPHVMVLIFIQAFSQKCQISPKF